MFVKISNGNKNYQTKNWAFLNTFVTTILMPIFVKMNSSTLPSAEITTVRRREYSNTWWQCDVLSFQWPPKILHFHAAFRWNGQIGWRPSKNLDPPPLYLLMIYFNFFLTFRGDIRFSILKLSQILRRDFSNTRWHPKSYRTAIT